MSKLKITPLWVLLLAGSMACCNGKEGQSGQPDTTDTADTTKTPEKPTVTPPDSAPAMRWSAAADSGSRALLRAFWDDRERYFLTDNHGNKTFQYWPQAHALDVLIDAYERSGDDFYKAYFALWFDGVKKKNGGSWYNSYFDDMEWVALALLRAYNATGDPKYRAAALELWGYIAEGWNDYAGGGIAWERNGHLWSKNACSNGPACILAARLYRETGDETYKTWALNIYSWQRSTLFNPNSGAVYDNINGQTGEKNTAWIFTYNQGTFIGAAVALHKITGDNTYVTDAVRAAEYATTVLLTGDVLKDEGSGDGGLFKGIFVRYFTELIRQEALSKAIRERYTQFLQHNAETLWTKGTNKAEVLFGPNWNVKPGAETGLTEQVSGCMLMEAVSSLGV
jgi:predicted alpha-1,6-mannanase (GH76 family)